MTAKKPTPLKLLANTYRGDRDGPRHPDDKLPLMDAAPEPPAWLKQPEAVAEWRKLSTMLANNRLLNEACLAPFAVMCGVYGRLVKDIAKGRTPSAALLGQYRALCSEFGLTPLSLSKLPRPGIHRSDNNPFAKYSKPFAEHVKPPRH